MNLGTGKMEINSPFFFVVDKMKPGKEKRGRLFWRSLTLLGVFWSALAEKQMLDKVPGFFFFSFHL